MVIQFIFIFYYNDTTDIGVSGGYCLQLLPLAYHAHFARDKSETHLYPYRIMHIRSWYCVKK